jgi:hypothetical protein
MEVTKPDRWMAKQRDVWLSKGINVACLLL